MNPEGISFLLVDSFAPQNVLLDPIAFAFNPTVIGYI